MSIISDSLKKIKPSPTINIKKKARELNLNIYSEKDFLTKIKS